MTQNRTVVKVKIGSEEYSLRSDRSEAHTRSVAEHVDRALREVQSSGAIVETHKAAILAALSIADELFHAKRAQAQMADRLNELADELSRLLPPAKRSSRTSGSFASAGDGT
ncbi:MAG TPA: cell division protein ZapA [Gemmatimonadales bacterium]